MTLERSDEFIALRPPTSRHRRILSSEGAQGCSDKEQRVATTRQISDSIGKNSEAIWNESTPPEELESAPTPSRSEPAHPVFGVVLNGITFSRKRKRKHLPEISTSNAVKSPFKRLKGRSRIERSSNASISNSEAKPTSPLFFSHSPQPRPQLPRFSSSEASVTMMNNVSAEESSTPTLLQGMKMSRDSRLSTVLGAKLPSSQYGRIKSSRTDEVEILNKGLQDISQMGALELLEQDDRLVFIIDLSNRHNFNPGPLSILFANATLKGVQSVYDAVQGRNSEDPRAIITGVEFPEFKTWSTSFVEEDQAMDVTLPAYAYGGVVWTCVNLRKKFRVFYGILSTVSGRLPANGHRQQTPFSKTNPNDQGSPSTTSVGRQQAEVVDYFGTAKIPYEGPLDANVGLPDGTSSPIPSITETMGQLLNNSTNGSALNLPAASVCTPGQSPLSQHMISMEELQEFSQDRKIRYPLGSVMSNQGFFDWTRLPFTSALPKHIQFAKSIDWASTSLGPVDTWSAILTSISNLLMASPHPTAMYWGENNVAIYNEPYILLAGQKHPKLMGQTYVEAWGEIWNFVKDSFVTAKEMGQAVMKDDDLLFVNRQGFLEETYFSWSLIPIVGADGKVAGLFNPAFEKTRRKIAERRMLTLREVGETIATAREVKDFWSQVLKGLEINEYDAPFVLLYSVGDENDSDSASIHSSSISMAKSCFLEGTLPEIPHGHPIAPPVIDLRSGTDGFAIALREAVGMDKPILLETSTGTLNAEFLDGFQCRGFPEKPRAAIVCPIHPTTGDNVIGFLIMGVNPRRPYDDDYSLFIQLLSRQLATSMASVVLFEEEIKRGQRAAKLAALDRIELSEQLAARTQEAVESENKFTRMAELAPVGMFIADRFGKMMFTNETFHKISGTLTDPSSQDMWMESIVNEDRPAIEQRWQKLIDQVEPMSAEFRFKTPWEDPNGAKSYTWVIASAYPEKYDDGGLKTVFGSITEISQQKWAQDLQKKRTEEAVELKRQQSNFIDMTSHEMRNPLSAILQCADEITRSLSDFKAYPGQHAIPSTLIDSNIDAAQTITLCANHQTRIVSDVLTLSKLDSALLLVTPVDVQPASIVQQALKMFDGELQTADIKMQFRIDSSLHDLGIEWVRLDPSRLLQVLINLTTNAIKFTSSQAKRTITIGLSASLIPPSEFTPSLVSYIPSRSKRDDVTEGKDWGTGDNVYLNFAVQDTGKGLTEDERKLLFLRFSQASPKTHVQYGGSGLGLFISRELVELQGGEIGVSSESGKGSTFAFYVKAKKSNGPADGTEELPALTQVNSRRSPVRRTSKHNATTAESQPSSVPKTPVIAPKPLHMKVMIVEDNIVNQRVLSKALRNQGCDITLANHGGECLDQLRKTRLWNGCEQDGENLDIILMDLEMPVMDGLTCTRTIRELQAKGDIVRHIPIIAVYVSVFSWFITSLISKRSANARSAHVEGALAAGMVSVYVMLTQIY